MNRNSTTRTPNSTTWRVKSPSLYETGTLLNLLPSAAALMDRLSGTVLLANTPLLQITAFTQQDIAGQPIQTLFPDFQQALIPDEQFPTELARHKRKPLSVRVDVHAFDQAAQYLILLIIPESNSREEAQRKHELAIQTMTEIAHIPEMENLNGALERIGTLILEMFEARLVCIYMADTENPRLMRISGVGECNLFPDELPSTDLIYLSAPEIWTPGKRVVTEIHRAGRITNCAYVGSSPLGHQDSLIGLLVFADAVHKPEEHWLDDLKIIGAEVGAVFRHFLLMEALELKNGLLDRINVIYKSVLTDMQECVFLLGPDFRVMEINQSAERLLGYANWEVRDQYICQVLISSDVSGRSIETILREAQDAVQKGDPPREVEEISLHRRSGQIFPAHLQITPVQVEGNIRAILVFISDVSEQLEVRIRTQQLEQRAALGTVAATFAHEVNNQMNNLMSTLQVMADLKPPEHEDQKDIANMLKDCDRIKNLMESTLHFARQSEFKTEQVNIETLLQRLVDRWRPQFKKANVTPFFQIEKDIPLVIGDPRALERVFINLIKNAVEAMSSSGGNLGVKLQPYYQLPNRPQVEITISDDGPGIPDDIKESIFEPFKTTKANGTGLGLAITKTIITAHRGSIKINSFPGGTVFSVYLPAVEGEKTA